MIETDLITKNTKKHKEHEDYYGLFTAETQSAQRFFGIGSACFHVSIVCRRRLVTACCTL
jgi:hypothetical protein